MIIAIPVENKKKGTKINNTFARAPYMYLFDTEKKEGTYIDNSASYQTGGAGINASQLLADKGVQVLLAPKVGENAAKVLKVAKIKVYKSVGSDIEGNLDGFLKGILEEI